MATQRHFHVLDKFRPYLHLLQVYNSSNFPLENWHHILHKAVYALVAFLVNMALVMVIILGIWDLIENRVDLRKVVAGLPILTSLLQMEVKFVALILKNHTVNDTINKLQRIINQRKSDSKLISTEKA